MMAHPMAPEREGAVASTGPWVTVAAAGAAVQPPVALQQQQQQPRPSERSPPRLALQPRPASGGDPPRGAPMRPNRHAECRGPSGAGTGKGRTGALFSSRYASPGSEAADRGRRPEQGPRVTTLASFLEASSEQALQRGCAPQGDVVLRLTCISKCKPEEHKGKQFGWRVQNFELRDDTGSVRAVCHDHEAMATRP